MTAALGQDYRQRREAPRSRVATALFNDLMAMGPDLRRAIIQGMDDRERVELFVIADLEAGSPMALYQGDPVGFVEDVLGDSLWSKQREIMRSVADNTQTAVPSGFGSSKTMTASRLALWWTQVHAPGTALCVTVAPRWRQVYRIIWPEIRDAHRRAGLLGNVDMSQLKIPAREGDSGSKAGNDIVAAYGFAANPTAEESVQGIHKPNLLLIVDEAGGIARTVGQNFRAVLTGSTSKMLAIGNPATDDEGSWFEQLCTDDNVHVIRIAVDDTPNLTDEKVGRCYACPPEVPAHPFSNHLVDRAWRDATIRDFGIDSPYVVAKVFAKFPRGGSARTLPYSWVEWAMELDNEPDPAADGNVWLSSLDLEGERGQADELVQKGAWIRLGVDVAADGGDEMVIARSVGDLFTLRHFSSGETNANAVDVAGKVLVEIKRAEALREALGTAAPVKVKVDAIGVGWGVTSTLAAWGMEGLHNAEIVGVNVAENTDRDPDPAATFIPYRKRDEMWLGFRDLLPRTSYEPSRIRLRIDRRTFTQLTAPTYATTAGSFTTVESKKSMRKRGVTSPDRAEALLLTAYEPAPPKLKRKKAKLHG